MLTAALVDASPDLLAYFRRRVDPQDAPDLLGDVMVTAWRCAKDVPSTPEEIRMWLFAVARGALRNHERGARRRWALADRIRGDIATATTPPADGGVEVRDAIARLPPDLAEVVQLVHWEKLSLAQVAQVMGTPASTVRGRYQRAKELLRDALAVRASSVQRSPHP